MYQFYVSRAFAREHCSQPRHLPSESMVQVKVPAAQRTFPVKAGWSGSDGSTALVFSTGWREVMTAGGIAAGQRLRLSVLPDGTYTVERVHIERVLTEIISDSEPELDVELPPPSLAPAGAQHRPRLQDYQGRVQVLGYCRITSVHLIGNLLSP